VGAGATIDIDGLTVSFSGKPAVDQVSVRINAGEGVGLVGESGSGKSTVLRALCGLVPQTAGAIRIDGGDVGRRELSRLDRARLVQMVFQDPYGSLHPSHTVGRTLAEPLRIHGRPVDSERIEASLSDVGLDHALASRFPHQLSGGQRQRVAIARALMLSPRILLLDEPTSALDVSVQAGVLNLLRRLHAALGMTVVLVSHSLPVVMQLCSRILVMDRGRIVEELSRDDILNEAVTSRDARILIEAARRRSISADRNLRWPQAEA
jgi:peptide/nickel transport system ATP-binding protein